MRRGALAIARRALPQRCELCTAASGSALLCPPCARELPALNEPCAICASPIANSHDRVCGACIALPPPFDATVAAWAYAFPLDQLVHAFKYRGRVALADIFAAAIVAAAAERSGRAPDVLLAVPLSSQRQRDRGYNQAGEIARQIAAITAIPFLARGLRRQRATPPQAALPWADRARNVRGAFGCDVNLTGLHVAVVDDVMTTGASLAECARTVRTAGAATVRNWVVARTPPPN